MEQPPPNSKEVIYEALLNANARNDELQAQVDRLMLEYCPGEMTAEQKANWAAHQKGDPGAGESLDKALGIKR